MRTWPPADPVIRVLADAVDGSPRRDWWTSGQRQAEAERIVETLRRRGLKIVEAQLAPESRDLGYDDERWMETGS